MKLSEINDPREFQRLEALLDELLDSAPEVRAARLAALSEQDQSLLRDWLGEIEQDTLTLPRQFGPWQLKAFIGSGGFGMVYRAARIDGEVQRDVALKLLLARSARPRPMVNVERDALSALDHPNIARLWDAGTTDGMAWLALEWVDGMDLDDWLGRVKPTLAQRIDLICALAQALSYAHLHLIVHRDLKPSNVRITAQGAPKLLDFGIARILDGPASQQSTCVEASPAYAAPEQLIAGEISTRVDVFGLGALLYYVLSEKPPRSKEQRALTRDTQAALEIAPLAAVGTVVAIDRDLAAIVAHALKKDPQLRYASIDAMLADLHSWQRGNAIVARTPTLLERVMRLLRQNRTVVAFSAALLVSLSAGLLTSLHQRDQARSERDAARAQFRQSQVLQNNLLLLFRDARAIEAAGASADARLLLRRAMERLDERFTDAPQDRAAFLAALGNLYIFLEDYASARMALERALAVTALAPAARTVAEIDLAQVELRLGEVAQARTRLDQLRPATAALPARVTEGQWQFVHGQVQRQRGEIEASLLAFARARALLSDGDTDRVQIAVIENSIGVTEVARGKLRRALEPFAAAEREFSAAGLPTDQANALNNLGAVQFRLGQTAEAKQTLARALALRQQFAPNSAGHAATLLNLARVHAAPAEIAKALDLAISARRIQRVLKLIIGPEPAQAEMLIAELLLRNGQTAAAQAALADATVALQAMPTDHPLRARAALVAARVEFSRGESPLSSLSFAIDALRKAGPAARAALVEALEFKQSLTNDEPATALELETLRRAEAG